MEFENIHKEWKRFEKLLDNHGVNFYIERCIEWDKVAYCRHIDYKEYIKVTRDEKNKGIFHFKLDGKEVQYSKVDFAYSCDLYDKDGKLLNIALFGM